MLSGNLLYKESIASVFVILVYHKNIPLGLVFRAWYKFTRSAGTLKTRALDSACSAFKNYIRGQQSTVRVPSVARGTIFNDTLSELNYWTFCLNKIYPTFDNFIVKFQYNMFRT
jgi:hypothetical protein